jgi:hypothetical protein
MTLFFPPNEERQVAGGPVSLPSLAATRGMNLRFIANRWISADDWADSPTGYEATLAAFG